MARLTVAEVTALQRDYYEVTQQVMHLRTLADNAQQQNDASQRLFETTRSELVVARRETEVQRKLIDELRERALSDRCENARLGGMLDMLRELGMIPPRDTNKHEPMNIHNIVGDFDPRNTRTWGR